MPPRTPLWKSIQDTLSAEIASGRYGPGSKLPTEAQLASRFGVNRHTVRRALAALADKGLVQPRRGAGVFVTRQGTDYPLGRRVRFHQNLAASGRAPTKDILHFETRTADGEEAAALSLAPGDLVHVYEGVSRADGEPIALFRAVFPATRLPDLPDHLDRGSVTLALAACGITDYTRAWSRLNAMPATATQALHLDLAEGAPLLRCVGLNTTPDGVPIEYGRTWFAGDRVTLTVPDDPTHP